MDETLLHTIPLASSRYVSRKPDATINFFKNGDSSTSCVYRRPGMTEVLAELRNFADLNIFTLGTREYAMAALEGLRYLPFFSRIFTREDCEENARRLSDEDLNFWRCTRRRANMMKDLRLVCPDTSQVVAIDNNPKLYPLVFAENLVPITSYETRNPAFHSMEIELEVKNLPCAVVMRPLTSA